LFDLFILYFIILFDTNLNLELIRLHHIFFVDNHFATLEPLLAKIWFLNSPFTVESWLDHYTCRL